VSATRFSRSLLIDVHGQGSTRDTIFCGTHTGATDAMLNLLGKGDGKMKRCRSSVARGALLHRLRYFSARLFGTTLSAPLFSITAVWTSLMPEQPAWRSAAFSSWCVSFARFITDG